MKLLEYTLPILDKIEINQSNVGFYKQSTKMVSITRGSANLTLRGNIQDPHTGIQGKQNSHTIFILYCGNFLVFCSNNVSALISGFVYLVSVTLLQGFRKRLCDFVAFIELRLESWMEPGHNPFTVNVFTNRWISSWVFLPRYLFPRLE